MKERTDLSEDMYWERQAVLEKEDSIRKNKALVSGHETNYNKKGGYRSVVHAAEIPYTGSFCFITHSIEYEQKKIGETDMDFRSIGLTGVGNARQLGGYIGADGRKIKENLLLRTGKLADADTEDLRRLREVYQLSEVVDFRTSFERDAQPDPVMEGVTNHHIGILDESSKANEGMAAAAAGGAFPIEKVMEFITNGAMEDMYVDIATNPHSQQGYSRFFQILLEHGQGAVLWHCTAGKDRTGFGSVLVLAALGVDRKTIVEDYVLTNHYYQKNIAGFEQYIRSQGYSDEAMKAAKAIAGAEQDYLEKALDVIDREYGSMDIYLERKLGLSVDNKQKLRDKFLEI